MPKLPSLLKSLFKKLLVYKPTYSNLSRPCVAGLSSWYCGLAGLLDMIGEYKNHR